MPQNLVLPGIREAVGPAAYDRHNTQLHPVRTTSLEASRLMLPYMSGEQIAGPQYAAPSPYVSAHGHGQCSPYLQTATPYSRHPSVSTTSISGSSMTFSAADSVDDYCTSPTASSNSSRTQVKSARRKRPATRKGRNAKRTSNLRKNNKAKSDRGELGEQLRTAQDVVFNYGGHLEFTRQQAGNEKRSGLKVTKLPLGDAMLADWLWRIDRDFKQAILDGKEEEFRADFQVRMNGRKDRAGDTESLVLGTLMEGTGPSCERGEGEICELHGKLNWIECRLHRVSTNFARRKAAFKARM